MGRRRRVGILSRGAEGGWDDVSRIGFLEGRVCF